MSTNCKLEEFACWQAARVLVKNSYQVSKIGSLAEDDYLKKELCAKAIQIMNEIAECPAASNKKEVRQYLGRASRGCYEIKSLLFAIEDLAYLPPNMVGGLHQHVDIVLGRIEDSLVQLSKQINLGFLSIQL